ncbi:hypothetical protein cypCar_00019815 [Cyprinus carpio]|uniref:Large ribosomal subunit protein bL35m n=3 Tax=Cyprinus carpio TaxID=7962 RepID=A0A8C1AFG6_CYPCA|nr:39S ribosomal protein L35, mitochondrial-like [Cyprinus carpio]KTF85804.1 hypothetical protein cypCar_00019815 [Cyprinus carpio]
MAATLTRGLSGLLRPLWVLGRDCLSPAVRLTQTARFSAAVQRHVSRPLPAAVLRHTDLLKRVTPLIPSLMLQPVRSLTYYSLRRGKRKSVKSVVQRFLRLHCGLWVRRKAGYKKKLWKKSAARKKRLREHVFCNKTQCKLLDKMTTPYWKRRNWYLNDPYQKYHDRVNLKV